MAYKTRIGILIGAILVFLILAPIVVLYTAGYRYNTKKMRVEKVGIIFVRSRPSGANIYLNGKKRTETTPARLRDLLPGDYDVKISKNGYSDWEKTLPVGSELTTFAESIALFKNSVPEEINSAPAKALNAAELSILNREDQQSFAAKNETARTDGFEIWVDDGNGGHDTVTRLSDEIKTLLFYDDNSWIIYETGNSIHAIERDGRDKRNDITLTAGWTNLNGLALSNDESVLYFIADKNGVPQLYKRQLR
jgi:PEGA domain